MEYPLTISMKGKGGNSEIYLVDMTGDSDCCSCSIRGWLQTGAALVLMVVGIAALLSTIPVAFKCRLSKQMKFISIPLSIGSASFLLGSALMIAQVKRAMSSVSPSSSEIEDIESPYSLPGHRASNIAHLKNQEGWVLIGQEYQKGNGIFWLYTNETNPRIYYVIDNENLADPKVSHPFPQVPVSPYSTDVPGGCFLYSKGQVIGVSKGDNKINVMEIHLSRVDNQWRAVTDSDKDKPLYSSIEIRPKLGSKYGDGNPVQLGCTEVPSKSGKGMDENYVGSIESIEHLFDVYIIAGRIYIESSD